MHLTARSAFQVGWRRRQGSHTSLVCTAARKEDSHALFERRAGTKWRLQQEDALAAAQTPLFLLLPPRHLTCSLHTICSITSLNGISSSGCWVLPATSDRAVMSQDELLLSYPSSAWFTVTVSVTVFLAVVLKDFCSVFYERVPLIVTIINQTSLHHCLILFYLDSLSFSLILSHTHPLKFLFYK